MRLWRLFLTLAKAGQALFLLVSLYQTAITVSGTLLGPPHRGRPPKPLPKFGLVVCARNEEDVVSHILRDFAAQEYPADRFDILVVAHNCSDNTAGVAAALGAQVVELRTRRAGKGLAVAEGIRYLGDSYDFVGVFDADSRVDPDFLVEVAAASTGNAALQVESAPQPTKGWVARGYGLDRRARNIFWWRPREALGLGTTINGSGFFVRPRLVRELLPEMRTLTEDLELTAHLYAAGYRIAFASNTTVHLEEPERLRPMVKQRTRWARGHFGVLRYSWFGVARRGLRGDLRALDMALYMLVPSRVITRVAVTLSALLSLTRLPFAMPLWLVSAGMLGEWPLPAAIAFRERLVPRSRQGIDLALRHAMFGLMWFPIGVWALVTHRVHAWDPTPRDHDERTRDAVLSN